MCIVHTSHWIAGLTNWAQTKFKQKICKINAFYCFVRTDVNAKFCQWKITDRVCVWSWAIIRVSFRQEFNLGMLHIYGKRERKRNCEQRKKMTLSLTLRLRAGNTATESGKDGRSVVDFVELENKLTRIDSQLFLEILSLVCNTNRARHNTQLKLVRMRALTEFHRLLRSQPIECYFFCFVGRFGAHSSQNSLLHILP